MALSDTRSSKIYTCLTCFFLLRPSHCYRQEGRNVAKISIVLEKQFRV